MGKKENLTILDDLPFVCNQMGIFAIVNREGQYVFVSDAWAKEAGVDPKDAIGKPVFMFYPNSRVMEVIESGKPLLAEPVSTTDDKITASRHFTSYFPIFRDKMIIGCVIQTFFRNTSEAINFSQILNKVIRERDYFKQKLKQQQKQYSIDCIIGNSIGVKKLKDQIIRASYTKSTVLIDGETGTGKELVAHSIHNLSNRSEKAMVKLNCSAIPLELAESELFGYEHGSFTGARSGGNIGKFELADKSTLFFDEIDQLSPVVQPKLLRALQEREITRIGARKSASVDVRIIAATNKSLQNLVKEGKFREDLYYRLNVINIHVPSLRERPEDIPLLIYHFIDKLNVELGTFVSGIDKEAIYFLQQYSWPGNIRELQNVIERAIAVTLHGVLTLDSFVDYFDSDFHSKKNDIDKTVDTSLFSVRQKTDRECILKALQLHNGNKKRTAEYLGISRTQLYNKLKEFDIMSGRNL